jgi:hypothetical protein
MERRKIKSSAVASSADGIQRGLGIMWVEMVCCACFGVSAAGSDDSRNLLGEGGEEKK